MPKKVISVNQVVTARVKRALQESGFSHRQLGEFSGYTQQAISKTLAGKTKLDIDKLVVFSKFLNKPVHYFLGNLPEE